MIFSKLFFAAKEVEDIYRSLKILIKTLQSCSDPFKDEKKIFLIYQIKESAIQMIDHYIKWITQLENMKIFPDKFKEVNSFN